jgi:hypothetical protein
MKLFKLNADYQVVPEKETVMLIPEFHALFTLNYNKGERDSDGRNRYKGTAELVYMYFFCDYRSEYSALDNISRKDQALRAASLPEDYKITGELDDACEKYMELQKTRELKLLTSSYNMIDKLDLFFNDVSVNHANFDKCMKHLGNLGDILKNVKNLEIQQRKQEGEKKGIRGGAESGFLK